KPAGADPTVEESAAAVVRLANAAATSAAAYQQRASSDADTARQHADAQQQLLQRRALGAAADRGAAALAEVRAVAEALAPGVLSAPWDNIGALWQPAGILDVASHVRAGSIRPAAGGGPAVPLLLPLLDHGNVLLRAPGDAAAVDGICHEIILRALLGTGAGQLSVSAYDPHLCGTTAPFTALRQVSSCRPRSPRPMSCGDC
ncbi:MAG: hypothetical protein ACYCO9_05135, partial [Streptosporangiaceae bacterium]